MRITKIYIPIIKSNLKFGSMEEPIEFPILKFDKRLHKIIFDDLAPDYIEPKPTLMQKIKRLYKSHF